MQGLVVLGNGPLAEAIRKSTENFTNYPPASLPAAQIIWCAYDTPITTDGIADGDQVLEWLRNDLTYSKHAVVLLSSQLPVGTCAHLEKYYPQFTYVVVPENIRASHNLQDWLHQPRIIVGWRDENLPVPANIMQILKRFTDEIIVVSPESAEMTKHAINGFLALSVVYGNEVARLSRLWGADPGEVAKAVMSDPRIGYGAYLSPGGPYGEHLAREVHNLLALGGGPLIQAIKDSNEAHTQEAT